MTNQTAITYTVQMVEMVSLPKTEYDRLITKNLELKNKILVLYDNERLLQETIKINKITINELRE